MSERLCLFFTWELRGWFCQTASPLYAHTAPFGRAVLLGVWGVHFLPRGKKRTKKTRQGLRPWIPRRPRRRNCSPCRQGKAQRFGQVQTRPSCRRLSTKMELGERSNAQQGQTNPSHNENGGVWLKAVLPNGRGTSMNPCRREIFGFPDAKIRFAKDIFATEEKC